jgi:hypothetical protein
LLAGLAAGLPGGFHRKASVVDRRVAKSKPPAKAAHLFRDKNV